MTEEQRKRWRPEEGVAAIAAQVGRGTGRRGRGVVRQTWRRVSRVGPTSPARSRGNRGLPGGGGETYQPPSAGPGPSAWQRWDSWDPDTSGPGRDQLEGEEPDRPPQSIRDRRSRGSGPRVGPARGRRRAGSCCWIQAAVGGRGGLGGHCWGWVRRRRPGRWVAAVDHLWRTTPETRPLRPPFAAEATVTQPT